MNYKQFIVRDPRVCNGQPVIKGTRVLVKALLASLAAGDRVDVILQSFPTLSEDDVWAVIAFAAAATVTVNDWLVLHQLPLP